MNAKYIRIKFSVLRISIGLLLGFVLPAVVVVGFVQEAQAQEQVRDKDNDVWTCTRQGGSCEFAPGRPNCDNHPSQGSQLNACGWVASNCSCEKAYKDKPEPAATAVPPTAVLPTEAPAPPTSEAPPPPNEDKGDDDDEDDSSPSRPSPVIQATPIPVACPTNPRELDLIWDELNLDEEIRVAYRWAYGEEIPQKSRMYAFCAQAPLFPDQAALSILAHPTYRNIPSLRRGVDWFIDVGESIEPKIDLFRDLGFWGQQGDDNLGDMTIVWCRGNGKNFCPSDASTRLPVPRHKGTVWADLALHFPDNPNDNWRPAIPGDEFFEKFPDMKAYPLYAGWVASFVEELWYYPDQGPGKFCPTRKDVLGKEVCYWTQGQWLVILYRINLIHQRLGIEPLGVFPTPQPSLTPSATP